MIIQNKKAYHDYFIEEKYEAGIVLEGWEVKAIRDNRINIKESYVIIQRGEIYLLGCHITPLGAASTHITPDAIRTRKLLLKGQEIVKLIGKVERSGFTLVPLDFHFSRGKIKVQIGLAKGKKQYDKRQQKKKKTGNAKKNVFYGLLISKHSIIRNDFGADPVSTWVTKQNRAYRGLVSS